MPETEVLFYAESDGRCPVLEWLDGLDSKVQLKCLVRIERLAELGHELRRPEADTLRDGVHELRASYRGVHHRILYFFHESRAVLVHGLVKQRTVPGADIERAKRRMRDFAAAPGSHIYREPR